MAWMARYSSGGSKTWLDAAAASFQILVDLVGHGTLGIGLHKQSWFEDRHVDCSAEFQRGAVFFGDDAVWIDVPSPIMQWAFVEI